jgi:hypothetical protein
MKNSILAAALIGAAIIGGIAGGGIQANRDAAAAETAWSQVLVVRGGTLIANPSAMTPRELADSQIIKRDPQWIAFCGNKAIVGDDIGEVFDPAHCKQAMNLDQAIDEAKTFEAL